MKNDGGPAFPCTIPGAIIGVRCPADGGPNTYDRAQPTSNLGLSLRAYFAAAAMQGALANGEYNATAKDRAEWACECADALLAELAK